MWAVHCGLCAPLRPPALEGAVIFAWRIFNVNCGRFKPFLRRRFVQEFRLVRILNFTPLRAFHSPLQAPSTPRSPLQSRIEFFARTVKPGVPAKGGRGPIFPTPARLTPLLCPTPNVFEPTRGQRRIACRRIDRAVAKVGLQRSGIEALVRQCVAAGMPKHVRVHLKADPGFLTGARQQLGKARWGERTAAFRSEDEGRGRLALELP